MTLPKSIRIAVHCESEALFLWLKHSLPLTSLEGVEVIHISSIKNLLKGNYSLVIVTEHSFKRLEEQDISFPILLLTEDFSSSTFPNENNLTLDTLPIPAVTINLLEHSIRSLFKDYMLTNKLQKLALHDHLTGAANRLLFEDRLSESIKRSKRTKEPLSIIYFDLDGFKPINDTYGHTIGDDLLKRFVKIITENYRETDTFARLGGDEFALILPNASEEALDELCQKIVNLLSEKQNIDWINIEIQCSMGGVSIPYEELIQTSKQEILKRADDAVYIAKEIKGTSYRIN